MHVAVAVREAVDSSGETLLDVVVKAVAGGSHLTLDTVGVAETAVVGLSGSCPIAAVSEVDSFGAQAAGAVAGIVAGIVGCWNQPGSRHCG